MPRADALRNRHHAIEGARAVLAERGLDAPLDEIARRAGIGNATLYRHFPARCDLVVAACADVLRQVDAASQRSLAEPDAWTGLCEFLAFVCELCARDRCLADLLTTNSMSTPELDALRSRPIAHMRTLLRRAKRQGTLRPDFREADIMLILASTAGLSERAQGRHDAWRRHLDLLLDGLRR
jgi:AcrR family transcriptional regulator